MKKKIDKVRKLKLAILRSSDDDLMILSLLALHECDDRNILSSLENEYINLFGDFLNYGNN